MGDIYRFVDVYGLTENAVRLGHAQDVLALIDTGAGKTVISSELADQLGGASLMDIPIEGQWVPSKLASITLHDAAHCIEHPVIVAVSDRLIRRAGPGPDDEVVQVLLGHDYLQGTLRYKARGDDVSCRPPARPRRAAGRR